MYYKLITRESGETSGFVMSKEDFNINTSWNEFVTLKTNEDLCTWEIRVEDFVKWHNERNEIKIEEFEIKSIFA
mgnify:CR=1 FL=1